MRRKLTPEQEMELSLLYRRMLVTLHFLSDVEDLGEFGRELNNVAKETYSQRDLRAMRLLAWQVDAFTMALRPHQREGLEALLKCRLGVDKEEERATLRKKVADVLARGRIDSENQRRKLEEYLEMLDAVGDDPEHADAVRRLLSK